jgi:phosphoenolpyruvate synthase/pyruvate phosphate dikinase
MRASGASTDQVRAFIYPKLAGFRKVVREMPLESGFVAEITTLMRRKFGPDGSYGVFVRSDTNAEDLPQFTGAGLNLTVPNVVGTERILQALRDVWASPFEERAYDWRVQALTSSERVCPSVVLLKTVANDKSGVLATANLHTLDTSERTVNVNEGVAAVVDGGVAESLLLKKDGGVRLLAQARAPYRKMVRPEGGFRDVPTTGSDYVLATDEIRQLRQLAEDAIAKFPPEHDATGVRLPWDIEFGFKEGRLQLFQIRPLVRFREAETLESLAGLEGPGAADKKVRLDEVIAQ